jgi:hypothetical protein
MKLRFAIYENAIAVYFMAMADLPKMRITLEPNRVVIYADSDGLRPRECPPTEPWPFRLVQVTELTGIRCGVMELSFMRYNDIMGYHGKFLAADLPPGHELPWPLYHEYEDGVFDKHTAVVREIRLRQDSLEQHGGGRRLSLPASIQKLLTPQERITFFQEFRI